MRLYVSNLPYSITNESLTAIFAAFGCSGAEIVRDRATGRPRGYGFVEVERQPPAGLVFNGRRLWLKEATARPKC